MLHIKSKKEATLFHVSSSVCFRRSFYRLTCGALFIACACRHGRLCAVPHGLQLFHVGDVIVRSDSVPQFSRPRDQQAVEMDFREPSGGCRSLFWHFLTLRAWTKFVAGLFHLL